MRTACAWLCILGFVFAASAATEERTVHFDKGEKDDVAQGNRYVVKSAKDDKEKSKKGRAREIKAIAYHVKNLKDADPQVRRRRHRCARPG
jgi:hypothetical protein